MKKHSVDLVSLVFGLVFAVVAVLWPLWRSDVLDSDSITWVPATALIAIGLLGLTLSITKARGPRSRETPVDELGYEDEPADETWGSHPHDAAVGDETVSGDRPS